MERGHYEVAKAYILYREKRSALRRVRHTIARAVGDLSLIHIWKAKLTRAGAVCAGAVCIKAIFFLKLS